MWIEPMKEKLHYYIMEFSLDTSDFTIDFNGSFINGYGNGSWNITFIKPSWPQSVTGLFTATLVEGGGITQGSAR